MILGTIEREALCDVGSILGLSQYGLSFCVYRGRATPACVFVRCPSSSKQFAELIKWNLDPTFPAKLWEPFASKKHDANSGQVTNYIKAT